MAGKPNFRRANFANIKVKTGVANGREALKKGDARLRIIQKKRSKLVDARDRLAQMAKKTDARAKIMKLRQTRVTGVSSLINESVRPVGSSILMKTDRNGKISLSTNKSKKTNSPANMNAAIQKELGLADGGHLRKRPIPSKSQMIMQLQRANNVSGFRSAARQVNSNIERISRNVNQAEVFVPPFVIKRTIRNDAMREMHPPFDFPQQRPAEPSNMYTWVRPTNRQAPPKMSHMDGHRQSVEVTARNNYMEAAQEDWNYADPSVRSFKMSSMYIDEDDDEIVETPPHRSNVGRIKTGVHARLDTPAVNSNNNQSQGIFAGQAKTKVVVPVGHRIVVSNLQPTVTQDDIRELFEDIGELLVSRLVRPGTAEVIYKNLKDAQKAVDTYHNRQLDGQPMKCLLVNKRPVNNPTAPALHSSSSRGSPSVLRSSGGITKKTVTNKVSSANKLVPDLSTIHKVLFRKT